MGSCPEVVLTAGAVIDRELLRQEIARHRIYPKIHPHAAMIGPDEKLDDGATVSRIASTGQGVGPALMKKMGRQSSLKPVFGGTDRSIPGASWMLANVDPARHRIFMEVSQGFSLGINSGFYPYTTSRECTPTQALADACLPAQRLRSTIMAVRTFPIRVGNAGNVSSGPCYNDQREIEWSEIGVEPELTTVTQRPRRLFTWSPTQFLDSLRVIEPDVIFVNFTNYLREPGGAFPDHDDWMLMVHGWVRDNIWAPYCRTLHREPRAILTGCGPRSEHVGVWER
jgi:adenylosuccinate synthase